MFRASFQSIVRATCVDLVITMGCLYIPRAGSGGFGQNDLLAHSVRRGNWARFAS